MAFVVLHWPSFGPYHLARLRACQRLAPSGTKVIGLAVAGEVEGRPWARRPEEDGVRVRVAFPNSQYNELRGSESGPALWSLLNEIRPVAVGIAGYGMSESRQILKWCRLHRALRVLMSESKEDDAPRSWFREQAKRFTLARFDSAVCGGTPHRRYLEKLGMRSDRIFDKYDVVDNEAFAKASSQARNDPGGVCHLPGLDDARPFFLVSSRLIERKNLCNLLLSFEGYRRVQPAGWRLIILGVGDGESALKQLMQDRGIPDVVFAGFHQFEALAAYYGLASAFIHPALQEQWGLVINEAMACGLPVIVSKTVGAATDLVKEGVNGFTFDPSNIEALSALMSKICSPSFPLDAFGRASLEIISEWTPEHFAKNFWLAVEAAGGAESQIRQMTSKIFSHSDLKESARRSGDPAALGRVLEQFFELLDQDNIVWAVLRGSEGLPDHARYDVDLLIEPKEMNRAEILLTEAAVSMGWRTARVIEKLQYRCCMLIGPGSHPRFVPVDFFGRCLHRFYPIADEQYALHNRRRTARGIWIVPPGFGAALAVTKELMRHDTFKENSRAEVREGATNDPEAFLESSRSYLGETLARQLLQCSRENSWNELEKLAPEIRRAVHRQRLRELPSACAFFAKNLLHNLHPPLSAFVVFLGPDGAGKSTIGDLVATRLYQRPFKLCRRFEYNFRLLPELKTLKSIFARLCGRKLAMTTSPTPGTKGSGMNAEHPGWRAMLYITYYSLDLALGRVLLRRLRGQGGLILFARYFHDYHYLKGFQYAPHWFLRLIEHIVPAPDLILYLHRSAEEIYAAKPELDLHEVRHQQSMIQSLVAGRRNALVVDASAGIESTVNQVADLITRKVLRDLNGSSAPGSSR